MRRPPRAAPGGTAALPLRGILAEFAVTTVLLFVVVTIVRWLVGAGSPLQIRDPHLALDVIGPLSGAVIALLIISPLGRLSGGHMNPAVTIALWLMDAFPGASVVPYVVAQLAGSAAGTALGRLAWGGVVSSHSVDFASIRPEAGWDGASVFLAEAGAMMVLTLVVGNFLAYPRVARWLPPTIGAAIAVLIVVLGPLSGGSANPARQFGPACSRGPTLCSLSTCARQSSAQCLAQACITSSTVSCASANPSPIGSTGARYQRPPAPAAVPDVFGSR